MFAQLSKKCNTKLRIIILFSHEDRRSKQYGHKHSFPSSSTLTSMQPSATSTSDPITTTVVLVIVNKAGAANIGIDASRRVNSAFLWRSCCWRFPSSFSFACTLYGCLFGFLFGLLGFLFCLLLFFFAYAITCRDLTMYGTWMVMTN